MGGSYKALLGHPQEVRIDRAAFGLGGSTVGLSFTNNPPTSGNTVYNHQAFFFNGVPAGRGINVMPNALDGPADNATIEGWNHQHCDELGDQSTPVSGGPRAFPWAVQVVTAGQTACPGWKNAGGTTTINFRRLLQPRSGRIARSLYA